MSAEEPARAIPPAAPPLTHVSSAPSAAASASGPVLPYGSPLLFVLDDKIDSGKTPVGTMIHLHLQSALVVNGVTVAPMGAPATLTVLSRTKAQIGDQDGVVQVHIDPFVLPGRDQVLPMRVVHEFLTIEHTGGQIATRDTTDTIGDIFIPYHSLYRIFRPGHQFVLPPGAVLRAETQETIDASNPKVLVFTTPPPFASTYDVPHSDLTAQPFYTPAPPRHTLPKGKPTLPPTPVATVSPVPTATPTLIPTDTPVPMPSVSGSAVPQAVPVATGSPAPSPSPSPTP